MNTLADYLGAGLAIVSIGLNPSLRSVEAGFYFANPRNRFWRALSSSGLIAEPLEPGRSAMERLFEAHRMGFTDVVKRPTAGGSDLKAPDYREWAPVLRAKLLRYQPRIAWFHGKMAYRNYLKYGEGVYGEIPWGEQSGAIGSARVFVTPNPSPANAAYSLDDLVQWYKRLKQLQDRPPQSETARHADQSY